MSRAIAMIRAGDRSGAIAVLRRLRSPPAVRELEVEQLALPMMDTRFECLTLKGENICVGVCIARQAASDVQRTTQRSRGQGTEHPSCDSLKCAQGRAIRQAFDPTYRITWRGEGPGRRFAPRRNDLASQESARRRLAALGLLDEVPTVDGSPHAVESEGEE